MYNITGICGGRCGLFGGDIKKLREDLGILKPTIFASVPRLYNRFFAGMKLKAPQIPKAGMLAGFMGGKVRMMLTASAPLSVEVKQYLVKAIGCPMLEAYG